MVNPRDQTTRLSTSCGRCLRVWPGADQRGHHIPSGGRQEDKAEQWIMKTYEDLWRLLLAVWPPVVTPRLILFMWLKTRQGTQLQYLVQLPSILKCAAVDPLISTIWYHISVLIFGIINVLLHNCNWRTNTTPYKARGQWISSNLSAFRTCICSSPLIMISADGSTWGKYLSAKT